MIRLALLTLALLLPMLATAAPGSYSGNIEPGDGGGPLPGASIVIGIVCAALGVWASSKDGGGLGDALHLAFWLFCIGAVVGLPVAWMLS